MNQPPQPMHEYNPVIADNQHYGGGGGGYGGGGGLESLLMSCDNGVVIRQKADFMEMMTGCERENIYYAYKAGQRTEKGTKKKGHKIFKFKEKSTCMQRCAAGSCKRFGMKCMQYDEKDEENDKMIVLRGEKECKCTYFCLNRTEMKVYETKGGEHEDYIGRVYDPCDMCNFGFKIYDKADVCIYGLKASCMQCYFWCRCPCDSCQIVNFDMTEGETDKIIGQLMKRGRGCARNMVLGDDNDVFVVDFPSNSDYLHRALLMKAAIFIDYTMFEDSSQNKQQGQVS
jgi:hypothetical protein